MTGGLALTEHTLNWLALGTDGGTDRLIPTPRAVVLALVDRAIERQGASLGRRRGLGQYEYTSENALEAAQKAYDEAFKSRDQAKIDKAFGDYRKVYDDYVGEGALRKQLEDLADYMQYRVTGSAAGGAIPAAVYDDRRRGREKTEKELLALMEGLWPGWYKAHLDWEIYRYTGGQPEWYRTLKEGAATTLDIGLQLLPFIQQARASGIRLPRVSIPRFQPQVPVVRPPVATPSAPAMPALKPAPPPGFVRPPSWLKTTEITMQPGWSKIDHNTYEIYISERALPDLARIQEFYYPGTVPPGVAAPSPTPGKPVVPLVPSAPAARAVPTVPTPPPAPAAPVAPTGPELPRVPRWFRQKFPFFEEMPYTPYQGAAPAVPAPMPAPQVPAFMSRYSADTQRAFMAWFTKGKIPPETLLDPARQSFWQQMLEAFEKVKPQGRAPAPAAPVPAVSTEATAQAAAVPWSALLPFASPGASWGGLPGFAAT